MNDDNASESRGMKINRRSLERNEREHHGKSIAPFCWTTKLPDREGWWWHKDFDTDKPSVREVWQPTMYKSLWAFIDDSQSKSVESLGGLWSSQPIPEPVGLEK